MKRIVLLLALLGCLATPAQAVVWCPPSLHNMDLYDLIDAYLVKLGKDAWRDAELPDPYPYLPPPPPRQNPIPVPPPPPPVA